MLEAARWAPSSFNEQPWRIVLATKDAPEAYMAALSCLTEKNRRWARRAWGMAVALTRTHFAGSGNANRHATHDLGLALGQLALQATALELGVHFLAGFDADAARTAFAIPPDHAVVAMFAFGHVDSAEVLPDDLKRRELAPRRRHPQETWVDFGTFGQPWTPSDEAQIEEILEFWFGPVDESGHATDPYAKRWWTKDPEFDETIRRRFLPVYDAIREGRHEDWLSSARGRLATIIVLDQFSRNMFRGTARMHESDARALDIALSGIDLGFDRALPGDLRAFCYMPLMHAESRAAQDACVRLFRDYAAELPGPDGERIRSNVKFAELHRDIIVRFGRFPHRNAILGRTPTDDERQYLDEGGATF
jgi:uncharacterized protein (DUF924 family)/nitroreductase